MNNKTISPSFWPTSIFSSDWIQVGSDIDGEESEDWSGYSISISPDGRTVAVGAPNNKSIGNGVYYGHVRVYRFDENYSNWVQLGSDIDGEAPGEFFGWSVSISSDGNVVAAGALYGPVRVYKFEEVISNWLQLGSDINSKEESDTDKLYEPSVSISSNGNVVAVGADSGHVRIYEIDEFMSNCVQLGSHIDGKSADD